MCVCVCVCACARARMCVFVRAYVHACVRVCVCASICLRACETAWVFGATAPGTQLFAYFAVFFAQFLPLLQQAPIRNGAECTTCKIASIPVVATQDAVVPALCSKYHISLSTSKSIKVRDGGRGGGVYKTLKTTVNEY